MHVRVACTAMLLSVVACGGGLDAGGEATTEPPVSAPPSTSTTRPAGDTSTTATGSGGVTSSTTTVATTPQTTIPTTTTATTTTLAGTPSSLIQAITADLVARRGVEAGQVELVSSERVDWPDGSLGCPVAGVSYIQVITPGYRIILRVGEEAFDYRATVDGRFRLCENPLVGAPSPNPES